MTGLVDSQPPVLPVLLGGPLPVATSGLVRVTLARLWWVVDHVVVHLFAAAGRPSRWQSIVGPRRAHVSGGSGPHLLLPPSPPVGPTLRVAGRAVPPSRWNSEAAEGRPPSTTYDGRYDLPAPPTGRLLPAGGLTLDWPEYGVTRLALDVPAPDPALAMATSVWAAPVVARPTETPDWEDRWPRLRTSWLASIDGLSVPLVRPCVLARTETAVLILPDLGLSSDALRVSVECWAARGPRPVPLTLLRPVPLPFVRRSRHRASSAQRLFANAPHLWVQTGAGNPQAVQPLPTATGSRQAFHARATGYTRAPHRSIRTVGVLAAWPALDLPGVRLDVPAGRVESVPPP